METPHSLKNGMQGVDALLICELEQKIVEMSENIKNIENWTKDQVQNAVDKLGEDIAIDINQIESTLKEMGNKIVESGYKNKREMPPKAVTGSITEDAVKGLIRN